MALIRVVCAALLHAYVDNPVAASHHGWCVHSSQDVSELSGTQFTSWTHRAQDEDDAALVAKYGISRKKCLRSTPGRTYCRASASCIVGYVTGLRANAFAVLQSTNGCLDISQVQDGMFTISGPVPNSIYPYQLSIRGANYTFGSSKEFNLTKLPMVFSFHATESPVNKHTWTNDNTFDGQMSGKETYNTDLLENHNVTVDAANFISEYSARLLYTLNQINLPFDPSTWNLTTERVTHDIYINGSHVLISTKAFRYTRSKVDNRPIGTYFSNRLYRACLRFATHARHGNEMPRMSQLLKERFGVSTSAIDYKKITNENATNFRNFSYDDLFNIAIMFEEMPQGMHKLKNLHTLVKRATAHPKWPNYRALAHTANGYIEFFVANIKFTKGWSTILHEKMHFVQHFVSPVQYNEFRALSNWSQYDYHNGSYQQNNGTNFVTEYAKRDPEEDFAESGAYYIHSSLLLQRKAPRKYDFIRKLFGYTEYWTMHDADLAFKLWGNLGRSNAIQSVESVVTGEESGNKIISVTVTLNPKMEIDASEVSLRLYPNDEDVKEIFFDMWLYQKNASVFYGERTLSKFAPPGNWNTEELRFIDHSMNVWKFDRQHFDWQCNVKNNLGSRSRPMFVPNSIGVEVEADERGFTEAVTVSWFVDEPNELARCVAYINPKALSSRPFGNHYPPATSSNGRHACKVKIVIKPSYHTGLYRVTDVQMKSSAGYIVMHSFNAGDPNIWFAVNTSSADHSAPTIERNSIFITSTQTEYGMTGIQLNFTACDEVGFPLDHAAYTFVDTAATNRYYIHGYVYKSNVVKESEHKNGNVTCAVYSKIHTLDNGNKSSTWALDSLSINDMAHNLEGYTYGEILQVNLIDPPESDK